MMNTPGRIRWSAIAIGFLVDNLISILVGSTGARFDPELAQGVSFATTAGTITSILLVLSTGFGGWLAGRLAKHEHVLHGTLVGGLGIIVMLVSSLFGQQTPLLNILLQCLAVGAGALGGWLSRRTPAQQQP